MQREIVYVQAGANQGVQVRHHRGSQVQHHLPVVHVYHLTWIFKKSISFTFRQINEDLFTFESERVVFLAVDFATQEEVVFPSVARSLGQDRLHRHQLEYVVRPVENL